MGKSVESGKEEFMLRPQVAYASQSERLRASMAANAITHGQTVRADLENVEVSTKAYSRDLVFFCRLRGLRVNQTVRLGDGGPLPREVVLHGLAVTREGFYHIRNALLTSNGQIEVAVDDQSAVVLSEPAVSW